MRHHVRVHQKTVSLMIQMLKVFIFLIMELGSSMTIIDNIWK